MKTKSFQMVLFVLVLIILYYCYNPGNSQWAPKCFFKLLTGLDCPGCGLQRAAHAFLHGNFHKAIQYNYFLIFSVPYGGLIVLERFVLKECSLTIRLREIVEHRISVRLYLVLYCVWFVLRNLLDL